jgi:hypothetical protein
LREKGEEKGCDRHEKKRRQRKKNKWKKKNGERKLNTELKTENRDRHNYGLKMTSI